MKQETKNKQRKGDVRPFNARVIPHFFDKNGNTLNEGDICFYSEYDGNTESYRYADCIEEIVEIDGKLHSKAHAITMDNANSFIDYEDKNPCELRFGLDDVDENGGKLRHFEKIGSLPDDSHMLSADYANKEYAV